MAVMMLTALSAEAQRTISGIVVDGDQKEPVIQATVALLKADSTLAGNAVTNTDGRFTMTAPADGRFLLRVTYVGYKTLYKNQSRLETVERGRGGEESGKGNDQGRHDYL